MACDSKPPSSGGGGGGTNSAEAAARRNRKISGQESPWTPRPTKGPNVPRQGGGGFFSRTGFLLGVGLRAATR